MHVMGVRLDTGPAVDTRQTACLRDVCDTIELKCLRHVLC